MTGLADAGDEAELVDLYGEGFDPLITPADEPDSGSVNKPYSRAVQTEIERLQRNDGIILVFPIWWWSFPAILKGWIDRVWNKDIAYGSKFLSHKRALAIGESLGIYRDYPVSKGCTSPFAPIWINEMVSRQG